MTSTSNPAQAPGTLHETPDATFFFVVDGTIVHYPYRAIGGGPTTPAAYGFEEMWTGGNCRAWARDFMLEGRLVHMGITDTDGTALEADPDGACLMCIYEGPFSEGFAHSAEVAAWVQLNQHEALSLDEHTARQEALRSSPPGAADA